MKRLLFFMPFSVVPDADLNLLSFDLVNAGKEIVCGIIV